MFCENARKKKKKKKKSDSSCTWALGYWFPVTGQEIPKSCFPFIHKDAFQLRRKISYQSSKKYIYKKYETCFDI